MTQRLAFAATAGVAAFIVVLLGALGTYVVLQGPSAPAVAATQGAQNSTTTQAEFPTPPPSGLDESADSTSAQAQLPQSTDSDGSESEGSDIQGYAISADDAVNIALNSAPASSLAQQPRLVNINGVAAYEVTLDKGVVYVDANSGQVLYNGTGGTSTQPRQRTRGFGRRP